MVACFLGYEAAVFAAASSYLQAKNTNNTNSWMGQKRGGGGGNRGTLISVIIAWVFSFFAHSTLRFYRRIQQFSKEALWFGAQSRDAAVPFL
jgi:hypothetical protein